MPSRRLGRSLGVDVVEFKTCSYDCVYCQLGRTTHKTLKRHDTPPVEVLVEQVKAKLAARPHFITLSGSGEPTLYAPLGELIRALKRLSETPIAVLTNGSLLWDEQVQAGLAEADLVVPSLDAYDEATFQAVNRPSEGLTFEQMLAGEVEFSRRFKGEIWLEVFLVKGLNDSEEGLAQLAEAAQKLRCERIQLNTVVRPPAEEWAKALTEGELARAVEFFGERAEVIADFRGVHEAEEFRAQRKDVLELVERRPCTVEDVAGALGLHRNEVLKYVNELAREGLIEEKESGGKRFWEAKRV